MAHLRSKPQFDFRFDALGCVAPDSRGSELIAFDCFVLRLLIRAL
jgi:hypothetical protein